MSFTYRDWLWLVLAVSLGLSWRKEWEKAHPAYHENEADRAPSQTKWGFAHPAAYIKQSNAPSPGDW
jgi:hypothetical protein